ncbi:MAG: hypothetical protein KBD01_17110 [Acidobacteria bacterium]|nr:hypothetical protein [Acidobacteriota bacterium]
MGKVGRGALVLLALVAVCSGCEQIRPPGTVATPLQRDDMASESMIPASYGRVIGVTVSDTYPGWAQLYFEEEAGGTIRVVFVSLEQRELDPKVLVIPRGGAARQEVAR